MASRDQRTNIFCQRHGMCFCCSHVDVLIIFLAEMLIHSLFSLELVGKSELGSLLLQLGKLVLVLGDLLEGRLDELALHVTDGGVVDVGLGAAPLGNDTEPLLSLALLLLLQLLGGLLTEKSPELLLPLGGHKSLLLGHDGGCP